MKKSAWWIAVLLLLLPAIASAKGDFDYLTVKGPGITGEINITNPALTADFFIFADFTQGAIDPPADPGQGYQVVRVYVETVDAGESATLILRTTAYNPGVITNSAQAHSDTEDPDTTNNSDSEDTTIKELQADLSVTKSDYVDPVVVGDQFSYSVVVTNNGPDTAENVILSDSLPSGTTHLLPIISRGYCDSLTYTIYCHVGTLDAGESATLDSSDDSVQPWSDHQLCSSTFGY